MAWTYTNDDPAASNLNQVRFQLGDTDVSDQQLSDAEISYQLDLANIDPTSATLVNTITVSIKLCRRLAAKYARQITRTIGRLSLQAETKYTHYLKLAAELQREAGGFTPYAGGISRADKQTNEEDTDRVKPFFSRNMMDEGQVADSPLNTNQELAV